MDAHGASAAASALRRRSSAWILRLRSCDIRRVFCVRRVSSVLPSFCCEFLDVSLCAASRLLAMHRLVCFFGSHRAGMSTSASSSFRSSSFSSSIHFRAISLGNRSVLRPVFASKEELSSTPPSGLFSSSLVGCYLLLLTAFIEESSIIVINHHFCDGSSFGWPNRRLPPPSFC